MFETAEGAARSLRLNLALRGEVEVEFFDGNFADAVVSRLAEICHFFFNFELTTDGTVRFYRLDPMW